MRIIIISPDRKVIYEYGIVITLRAVDDTAPPQPTSQAPTTTATSASDEDDDFGEFQTASIPSSATSALVNAVSSDTTANNSAVLSPSSSIATCDALPSFSSSSSSSSSTSSWSSSMAAAAAVARSSTSSTPWSSSVAAAVAGSPATSVVPHTWTVDTVCVTPGASHPNWDLAPNAAHNGQEIQLVFKPERSEALMRKTFTITYQCGTEEPVLINVRVAQEKYFELQKRIPNQDLPAFFRRVCNYLPDGAINDAETAGRMTQYSLALPPAECRVQNGNIQEPGAQMCAASLGLHSSAALVVIADDAYKYDPPSFCSMLRHENIHCTQYTASIVATSFWGRVREAQQVEDDDYGVVWLMTPICECEAWLWYLEDQTVSYYFLLNYRVFSELANNIYQSRTAIAGLRKKGSKQHPKWSQQEREQLAQDCEAYLLGIIIRARGRFPEIVELSNTDPYFRDYRI